MSISPADFDHVRHMVRRRAAIVVEEGKDYLVEARLKPLVDSQGFESLDDMMRKLRSEGDEGPLAEKITDAMSTKESSFFRDQYPFEALQNVILPELLEKRRATRTINIWCAAASTGQEPYTLAILLQEMKYDLHGYNVRLIASDLSDEALKRARAGIYSQLEVNRGMPPKLLQRYFTRQGLKWQVKEDVRKTIEFKKVNLIRPWPALPPLDVVMMRNVLIYFDLQTKKEILANVRHLIKQDSCLFLGGAETTYNIDDNFKRVQNGRAFWYCLR